MKPGPMYASKLEQHKFANLNAAVRNWTRNGESGKLILGISLFGRFFTLSTAGNNKLGATRASGENPGRFTKERSAFAYLEVR